MKHQVKKDTINWYGNSWRNWSCWRTKSLIVSWRGSWCAISQKSKCKSASCRASSTSHFWTSWLLKKSSIPRRSQNSLRTFWHSTVSRYPSSRFRPTSAPSWISFSGSWTILTFFNGLALSSTGKVSKRPMLGYSLTSFRKEPLSSEVEKFGKDAWIDWWVLTPETLLSNWRLISPSHKL